MRKVARVDTSPTPFERAVASEILAEIARQRLMHKEVQAESGVKQRAYSYYFIEQVRHIPTPALEAVSAVLGLRASEVMRRAEDRMASMPVEDDALTPSRPENRAAIEEGQKGLAEERKPGRNPRKRTG